MVIFIKTIGIVIREFSENNKKFMGTRSDLFEALKRFDVNTIGVPINSDFVKVTSVVDKCDGIILSGGSEFLENDFKLVEYLLAKDIPTLGICLGMQSMAEYFNDRQEIKVNNHYGNDKYIHKIKIKQDSLLYKILPKDEIWVNSRHHDGVAFTDMVVNAISEDGVIEGVELLNHKFFLGVQWHPESLDDNNSYLLFKYFVDKL